MPTGPDPLPAPSLDPPRTPAPICSSPLLASAVIAAVRLTGQAALVTAARNRAEISVATADRAAASTPTTRDDPPPPPTNPVQRWLDRRARRAAVADRLLEEVSVNEAAFVELLAGRAERAAAAAPNERGLLTASNHTSILDDPLMWATLFYSPAYKRLPARTQALLKRPENVRWALASHDICFQDRVTSRIFFNGKTLPTHRLAHSLAGGPFQPVVAEAIKLLSVSPHPSIPTTRSFSTTPADAFESPARQAAASWMHVFPEGRVAQPALEARFPLDPAHAIDQIAVMHGVPIRYFKWGVSRMILESAPCPDVVPMWISGFDAVAPEPHVLLDRDRDGSLIKVAEEPTVLQRMQARLPLRLAQIADWVNPPPASHHRRNSLTEGMPRVIYGRPIDPAAWDGAREEWARLVIQQEKQLLAQAVNIADPPAFSNAHALLETGGTARELRSRVAEHLRQQVLQVGRDAGAEDVLLADKLGLSGPSEKTLGQADKRSWWSRLLWR